MNYSTWGCSENVKSLTREDIERDYNVYATKMNQERLYYRKNFMDKYPSSMTVFDGVFNNENKILLYFDGHNTNYYLDKSNNIIYQIGYPASYKYTMNTAEYEYILDCVQKHREIVKIIFYNHLFDNQDNYHG
jgi:hypothetical protein